MTAAGNTRAFPGHVVTFGETDAAVVKAVQQRLNELGCGPVDADGVFGSQTKNAVQLFQARFADADGVPLKIDGVVGAITWAALFGMSSVPTASESSDALLASAVRVAASQVGVREQPEGSNRGPEVDKYAQSVGLNPADANPWCAAFVYFCFNQAAQELSKPNPVIKTGLVLEHWKLAGKQGVPRLLQEDAVANPALVQPGQIFILATGGGHGHTGLVEQVQGGKLVTIEGNTNEGGSREGIGVFRRASRKLAEINRGFIDYSARG
jgi:hypothetical protein